jgi:hypothetical protein
MNRGVVFAVGLALLAAESAVAADGLLPGSPVPEVELPEVELPVVEVPEVELPPIELPPLPVPVPTVAPPPAAPAAPAAPPAPRRESTSAPAATTSPSRPASRLRGARGPARGGSAPAARAPAGRAPATRARGARGGVLAMPRPGALRERRLHRTVTRLRGCLDGLPAAERRVLVLRTGLGARRARSRARVARALDVTPRRVARLERRGLRRLRGLARGGCGSAAAPAPAAAPGTTGYAPTWPALAPAALAAAGVPVQAEPDRVEVKGTQESGPGERESSSGGDEPALAPPASKPAAPPPAAVVRRGAEGSTDLTLPLLALVALLGIAFAVRAARRALRT